LERACLVDFDKSSPSPPASELYGSRVRESFIHMLCTVELGY